MDEFKTYEALETLQDDLQAWLREQYPLGEKEHPLYQNPHLRLSTIAKRMSLDLHRYEKAKSQKLSAIRGRLLDCEHELDQLLSAQSTAVKQLQAAIAAVEEETTKPSTMWSLRGGRQWLGRFVAEQCASHLYFATEKKLTFGTDPSASGAEPSTEFGRLVQMAFRKFNIQSHWRNPTYDVYRRFDEDALRVIDWS